MTMHAYQSTEEWLGTREENKGRAKTLTITDSAMRRARAQTEAMLQSGDWGPALGRHFVSLFMMLHEKVYGVEALEMDSRACFQAAGMAAKLQKDHFEGDPGATARFIIWVWEKERADEKWRRENRRDPGRRIGYRLQFGPYKVADYRRQLEWERGRAR